MKLQAGELFETACDISFTERTLLYGVTFTNANTGMATPTVFPSALQRVHYSYYDVKLHVIKYGRMDDRKDIANLKAHFRNCCLECAKEQGPVWV
jgi:hypothetical protein